ncbi:hypothetical protein BJP37_31395 [Moorena bouillonii PNG]|uniref:Uncharacterized protein n=1 Tax=Moorena bouillonii PNG TaxID=568701 RepID=A0A1U7NAA9_9CYAN|nr:hypothetical protein BJP37_31395 [Moorena bouillonii PNG]
MILRVGARLQGRKQSIAALGHTCRMGILVERASWWNGHLGGTGILVERASWWNGHLGGTGILVERASWWNGHLGGTGILVERASCPLSISGRAGRMPTLLLFITLFSNAKSQALASHS